MTSGRRFNHKSLIGILIALLLAVLAFSQAAASIGLNIQSFRPLGAGFFSTRSSQMQLARDLFDETRQVAPETALRAGRHALVLTPLSSRSLWLVGIGMEMLGREKDARALMQQAAEVSRRDRPVQLWLGADNIRKGAIAEGLGNFDTLLRTDPDIGYTLMPRMAGVITTIEGRQYLAPYVREDNPWLLSLLQAMVQDVKSPEPAAALLIERARKAPDVKHARPIYAMLIGKLVRAGSYDLAIRLYPLLPGASMDSLNNVGGVTDGGTEDGYPPFIWSFSDSDGRGAAFIRADSGGTGLDIFGAPGTAGIAASKIVAPGGRRTLQWRIADRAPNFEATAQWIATCLAGPTAGATVKSGNMLGDAMPLNRPVAMSLPPDCGLVRLDMQIGGGIGRTPANLIVTGLDLTDREFGK